MPPIVLQLQQEALDRNILVSDLLRKALVIARKLGLVEFQAWVESELSGYRGKATPDYREVSGDVRGWNPYNGWIPLVFEDPKEGEQVARRKTSQSIAELEHLVQGTEGHSLQMPYPQAVQRELSKGFGYETQVSLFTTKTSLIRIIDAVRTIILNWALKLEEDGILGEGLSFTTEERDVARKSPQIITNFYGPVQSPQIQQGNETVVQVQAAIDLTALAALLDQLKAALPNLGLEQDATTEVTAEIQTIKSQLGSPKPKTGILRESLRSIRTVLESAAGGAAGQLIIEVGKLLL
jgi:hypothetical protein